MPAPCNNCGRDGCRFCYLIRTDPRYAAFYGERDLPFASRDCIHRGPEAGRQKCESCGGNVEIKLFGCQLHGTCSLERDIGHQVCGQCPEKRPFDLQQAYDWRDLGPCVTGDCRKFNSSLLRFRGELILATRIHTRSGWSAGRIILCRLDDQFRRHGDEVELVIQHPQATVGIEDPRLFVHRGELHCAFTGCEPRSGGMVTNQLYARLGDDLQAAEVFAPRFAGRQPWEKNWGFFSQDDQLYAVYHIRGHKILHIDGEAATPAFQSQTEWPAGIAEPRGGSAPFRRGNEWYCFFHDVREAGLPRREYRLCLYTFEAAPPFRINRIARVPLFVPVGKHRPQDDWTPDVVFPCGSFLENNLWHVSAGYYDRWSWLLRFDVNQIEQQLDRASGGRDHRFFFRHEFDWDIWQAVVNQNEYSLPESLQGMRVIDVGGHIGAFARACLDRGAASVRSIEPLAEHREVYARNLNDHRGRWELVEGAACGKADAPTAIILGDGSGARRIDVADQADAKAVRSYVPAIPLGSPLCDLLKLDCEGAEHEILQHADLRGVRKIVGEGHHWKGLPGPDDLQASLERHGFLVRLKSTGPNLSLFWAERPEEAMGGAGSF